METRISLTGRLVLCAVILLLGSKPLLRPAAATVHESNFKGQQKIAGVVVDEAGRPIAEVRVEAKTPVVGFFSSFSMPTGGEPFDDTPRAAMTDAQGRFEIGNLPPKPLSEVQLSLRAEHRHVNDANYPIEQDARIEMRGSGQPGVIQGRVLDDATGQPILTPVEWRVVSRHIPTAHKFSTEDGTFTLPFKATLGRKSMIYVYAYGYAAAGNNPMAVDVGSDYFPEIMLKAKPPLRGKLVDATTGQPIAEAAIVYGNAARAFYFSWHDFDKYADGYHSLSFVQHETSTASGEFWFAEPDDGSLGTLFVRAEGYARWVLRPEEREFDTTTGQLVVRVPRESVFTGIVLQDGQPVPNAGVHISPPRKEGLMEQWYGTVSTGPDGRYRFGGLPSGDYMVSGGPYYLKAAVGEAQTSELNLGSDLGPLRIHGKAPANASITIIPEFDWNYINIQTKSNTSGAFECTGLRAGSYRARVHSRYTNGAGAPFTSGYEVPEFVVERDGQQVDLLPEPRGWKAESNDAARQQVDVQP